MYCYYETSCTTGTVLSRKIDCCDPKVNIRMKFILILTKLLMYVPVDIYELCYH